jgi:primosomal replication protein N''
MKTIEKFNTIIKQLKEQLNDLHSQNTLRSFSSLDHRFNSGLFQTHSENLPVYLNETETLLVKLQQTIESQQHTQAEYLIQKIENQLSALIKLVQSAELFQKAPRAKSLRTINYPTIVKTQSENQTKQPSLTCQQLYQKLAEHHEFERRLLEMIAQREYARQQSSGQANQQIMKEVLALNKRLGRCRQAISSIEKEIERVEKRL